MTICEVTGPADISIVRELFEEYAKALGVDLCFQNFSQELATLPGAYSPPAGSLWLAKVDSRPIGCVAVRRIDDDACEVKRLYVRREARGQRVGRALVDRAVDFAKAAGYKAMRLDTLPSMTTAQALYRELGFRDTTPYRYNPVPGVTYMELTLSE